MTRAEATAIARYVQKTGDGWDAFHDAMVELGFPLMMDYHSINRGCRANPTACGVLEVVLEDELAVMPGRRERNLSQTINIRLSKLLLFLESRERKYASALEEVFFAGDKRLHIRLTRLSLMRVPMEPIENQLVYGLLDGNIEIWDDAYPGDEHVKEDDRSYYRYDLACPRCQYHQSIADATTNRVNAR